MRNYFVSIYCRCCKTALSLSAVMTLLSLPLCAGTLSGSGTAESPYLIGDETTDYGFVKAYRSGFLYNGSYYAEEFATSACGNTVPVSWLDRYYDSATTDYRFFRVQVDLP